MAIGIEFFNVIVRKSAVEAKYPGGLDGFVRQELANYLEDEHILRVGFMSNRDSFAFVEELQRAGLTHSEDSSSDLTIIASADPVTPSWLSVGDWEGRTACWLCDQPPRRLVDLDPVLLLRCHTFLTVEQIVALFRRYNTDVQKRAPVVGAETVVLDCERGEARLEVEVFKESNGGATNWSPGAEGSH